MYIIWWGDKTLHKLATVGDYMTWNTKQHQLDYPGDYMTGATKHFASRPAWQQLVTVGDYLLGNTKANTSLPTWEIIWWEIQSTTPAGHRGRLWRRYKTLHQLANVEIISWGYKTLHQLAYVGVYILGIQNTTPVYLPGRLKDGNTKHNVSRPSLEIIWWGYNTLHQLLRIVRTCVRTDKLLFSTSAGASW